MPVEAGLVTVRDGRISRVDDRAQALKAAALAG
jgi:hypothetical protein